MSEETKKGAGMFGITQETKSSNSVPLLTPTKLDTPSAEFPSGWKFPVARLVNVVSTPDFAKKDGSTVPVLQFVFKDADQRQHTHIEWEIEANDAKFQDKVGYMNSRIKHIYEAIFGSFPEKGIGTNATSFAEFFNAVADAFNSVTRTIKKEGEEDKKVKAYSTIHLYYKLTYYKGNLRFPLSPNFLERKEANKPCKTLTINTQYDIVEQQEKSKPSGIPGVTGGTEGGDDLPSFDESYT